VRLGEGGKIVAQRSAKVARLDSQEGGTGMIPAAARLADAIVLSDGWRRALAAMGAGAISALAMPPFDLWPVLFLTFPALVWLIDGAVGRNGAVLAAARVGWLFGFGYFLAGLYWIGIAFLVDADTFGWLMPFAVLALPAGLALFTAAGVALARLLWLPGAWRVVALALGLLASEWVRGHVLTGFPWNAWGYALTGSLALAQSAAVIGTWGLTFLAVLIFAAPAVLADRGEAARRWPLGLAAGLLVAMAVFGLWRLSAPPAALVEGVKLRIVQPDIPQDAKFNRANLPRIMAQYLTLSDRATGPGTGGIKDVTHLIWPESAFPVYIQREPAVLAQIADLLPRGTVLLTGAVRGEQQRPAGGFEKVYNSIIALGDDGGFLTTYDKVTLVPFGEFLPFQAFLESLGLRQLTMLPGGFTPGTRARPMQVPGAPAFAPLVCYEAIFPGHVLPEGDRPGWILNVTNDGWFGRSSGPWQHLRQAQVRAIEEGLPLVRAANTGISAVIDARGRLLRSLPLGTDGVLDAGLPVAEAAPPYAVWRDAPLALIVLIAVGLVINRRWKTIR
jgi:apolipoprotein N-acyltransferase